MLASTIPLEQLVQDDRLLPDLQYRIGDLVIELPRLAQRRVDVAVLAYHFLDRERETGGDAVPAFFDPDALERMLGYEWPGNVRELERVVQFAVVRAAGRERIRVEDLPGRLAPQARHAAWRSLTGDERDALVGWALDRVRGRRQEAATLLGMHPNTIDNHRTRSQTTPKPPRNAAGAM